MKRAFIFLCVGFFIVNFSAAQSSNIRFTIIPDILRPGDPVTVAVDSPAKNVTLLSGGKQRAKSAFFIVPAEDQKPAFMAAIITIPSLVDPGPATLRIELESGAIRDVSISIEPREFRSETIRLSPAMSAIVSDPDPQKTDEAKLLWSILGYSGNEIYHSGPFAMPITSTRRTSIFGTRRVYQYPDGKRTTSVHEGVDFGAPAGTPVFSCGAGKVALARPRIVTGNTIIIEHAPAVYALYYHLERIDVKEGDLIETGTQIGAVGSTGFSTGPHLHWEIRVSGENTDPDEFAKRPVLDKDLLLSRINK
ncbi:MAG: M23 family metallopeptidase [Treponema sp.]|jgi:murein DD-endopeptidase MepM/ murein hydrolase activator NlpD|nr:M23 family metallopeptidase [Treponema sp.]